MQHVVIMAGGKGTRLWPLSTNDSPKQFQKFYSDKTLIQESYDRAIEITDKDNVWISTSDKYISIIKDQLPDLKMSRLILEPASKNTAPAIGLVAMTILKEDRAALITTIASDHYIGKPKAMVEAIKTAQDFITENPDYFVCVGANPTRPDTGLGYIKIGKQIQNGDKKVYRVEKFVEKPDEKTALKYYQSWQYLWNTAYFNFKAEDFLKNFKRLLPDTFKKLEKFVFGDDDESQEIYHEIASEPIEPPVIEKLEKLAVVPADMTWDDIGNWASLHNLLATGNENNAIKGEHIGVDTDNCYILSSGKRVFTIGLKDIIIVDTPGALMVCNKNQVQRVKDLVEKIKDSNLEHLV